MSQHVQAAMEVKVDGVPYGGNKMVGPGLADSSARNCIVDGDIATNPMDYLWQFQRVLGCREHGQSGRMAECDGKRKDEVKKRVFRAVEISVSARNTTAT